MAEEKPIPVAKPAATILMLRDGPDNGPLEVFMVVRHHQIDFASGALVFPGGKANEGDHDPNLRAWCDGAEDLDDRQLAIAISAIREAFEESGILLARNRGEEGFIAGSELTPLEAYRAQLDKQEISILSFVKKHDLRLAIDALVPFAHWITPEFMPKRFDTHFFVAIAPADQVALHDGSETVDSVWVNPNRALVEAEEGKWTIIFPTRMNVEMLGRSSSAAAAIDAAKAREVVTVFPQIVKRDEGTYLTIPEEAGYVVNEERLDNIGI